MLNIYHFFSDIYIVILNQGLKAKVYQKESTMDIIKEQLTYSDTGDAVYTVQIKNFYNKLKNWAPNKVIETKIFHVQDQRRTML